MCLVNYNLHKCIITITLDNVSINNVAIEFIRSIPSRFYEELFYVRLVYHIVNLIMNDGLTLM